MKYKKNKYFDKGGYGNNPSRNPKKDEEENVENREIIYYYPEQEYIDPQTEDFYHQEFQPNYYPPNYFPNYHPQPFYPPPPIQTENFQDCPPDCELCKKENKEPKKIIQSNRKTLNRERPAREYQGKIDCLDDLIDLSLKVEDNNFVNISLNQEHLLNLREPLIRLRDLIGMETIKKNIFNQLIFFLQNIEPQFPHMLHTCIEGPPGCGKTELANILALVYANLGIISESKVVIARRSDLVAGYLGQTAQKTQDLIDSAKGGVLLIDEAYSLGNEERKDSFAKECIDTLNQNLTEGKGDFICIIAGYKEDLEKSFFGFNSGLERRFPYRFGIEEYSAVELGRIYRFILEKNDWSFELERENELVNFLKENRENFKYNGGDLENLVHFTKLAYAKNRVFNRDNGDKKIRMGDVRSAYEMYMLNKKKVIELIPIIPGMYN